VATSYGSRDEKKQSALLCRYQSPSWALNPGPIIGGHCAPLTFTRYKFTGCMQQWLVTAGSLTLQLSGLTPVSVEGTLLILWNLSSSSTYTKSIPWLHLTVEFTKRTMEPPSFQHHSLEPPKAAVVFLRPNLDVSTQYCNLRINRPLHLALLTTTVVTLIHYCSLTTSSDHLPQNVWPMVLYRR